MQSALALRILNPKRIQPLSVHSNSFLKSTSDAAISRIRRTYFLVIAS